MEKIICEQVENKVLKVQNKVCSEQIYLFTVLILQSQLGLNREKP